MWTVGGLDLFSPGHEQVETADFPRVERKSGQPAADLLIFSSSVSFCQTAA